MSPSVDVLGRASSPTAASDHSPIVLTLRVTDSKPRHDPRIPAWVASHPLYEHTLGQVIGLCDASDPYERLLEYKDAAIACLVVFKRRLAKRLAVTDEERLYWAMVCYRAGRSGCLDAADRAARAYPRLAQYFNTGTGIADPNGLSDHIASLHRAICERQLRGLESEEDMPEDERLARTQNVQRRLSASALTHRRLELHSIVDGEGNAFASDDLAAEALREHWAKV